MDNLITSEKYKGYTIGISYDDDPMHPRKDWDNVGTIVTSHRHYSMGDEQTNDLIDFMAKLAGYDYHYMSDHELSLDQILKRLKRTHVAMPVYMYEHSGIEISTTPFSCSWESGLLGFIYVSKEDAKKEFGNCRNYLQRARKLLTSEVETYNIFCQGLVLCYDIQDGEGDTIDSLSGMYGDTDYALSEAKNAIDYLSQKPA